MVRRVVIAIASSKVVQRFDFGHGVRPHCAAMNSNDGLLLPTPFCEIVLLHDIQDRRASADASLERVENFKAGRLETAACNGPVDRRVH